ncbi:MAG: hypothetical protein ABS46_12815 [Cytophagaceae bacterium SCN 52-12]|nr:MAG: hypothetical protein ABS46_12815 [Cytophagaceae bacterium SCN 52-12]
MDIILRWRRLCLIALCCLEGSGGYAQNIHAWQMQFFSGRFITHRHHRTAPESSHYGVSLDFIKKTTGKKYWQYAHNYPDMGLSATWRTLGNPEVYGQIYSVVPYLEFSLFRRKTGAFQLKHGTGLAFAARTYDAAQNPQNRLLSTMLNATSMIDAGYRFFVSDEWDLKPGAMIYHYSNGGFRLPNAGINAGAVYLGLTWHPAGREPERTAFETIRDFKKWRYRLSGAAGFYDFRRENSPSIQVNPQLSGMVFLQHSTAFRTGIGVEAGRLNRKDVQPAIYMEEEIQFGKIATRYGFGGYLRNKPPGQESFYSKIGMAFYPEMENRIPAGIFVGSMLKAHGTRAAHIELMTGYVF